MLTLLVALLSLVALMIIHEFGHFIIAKKFGVKVEEFGIGYPPRLFGKKIGETIYSVNLIPLGAFVRIYGEEGGVDDYRSFSKLLIWKRVLICLGGVIAFWLASIVIFSAVFMLGATIPIGDQDVMGLSAAKVQIVAVKENSPAGAAGLLPGDTLTKARSQNQEITIEKIADFQAFVEDNKNMEIALTLNRNGGEIVTNVTPRSSYPEGEGPTGVVLERIGTVIEKVAWYRAPLEGVLYTGKITVEALLGIYGFFASLLAGNGVPSGAEIAGPVGITIFLSKAANFGLGFFLYFIGSLSVLLALFNLFPIPALDGGKLLFLTIEKIIKKPVSLKWEQSLTIFFFVLLITMSLFVTVRFDIPRVIDLWKNGS